LKKISIELQFLSERIMPASTEMIHVRVDTQTKELASEALAHMGLTVSDAVRLFLKRVVTEQAFPIELKVPNVETQAAMLEARAMSKARFNSAPDLFDALDKPAAN
jgi:DNA-damage-inducible protein J